MPFGLHGTYLQGVNVKSVGNAVGSGKSNSLTRTVSYVYDGRSSIYMYTCRNLVLFSDGGKQLIMQ